MTINADISPPHHWIKLTDVLDPAGAMGEIFCDEEAARGKEDALLKAYKGGDASSMKRQDGSYEPLFVRRAEFTFPVFNATFTRAVIFIHTGEKRWFHAADGKISKSPADMAGWVEIYHKRKGKWFLRAREGLYIT
ncbi:hypothetical protein [Microvirga terricola]|uniref:DUF4440 domain-containing protein n=1 Tax=Microvirga terricola TaxID=2719797 RepID=A0ABX0VDM8_9HYPH|nr:hypothetical protein [Microvirga terricola]NIX77226.1 hypothetical protein [Microvirga terricola]